MLRLDDPGLLRSVALVGGEWCAAASGCSFEVTDPATGHLLGNVPEMGAADARRAVAAAQAAWPAWQKRTAADRATVLLRWHGLLLANAEDLARILTAEQGKPLAEARAEIAYAASYVDWFAAQARRIEGEVLASPWPDRRMLVTREAVGVCAAITPWNFPAAMVTRKVAPALAAGCTVVLKPSELTPLTALALAVLAVRAGVPPGVLNVIVGDAVSIGRELCANAAVRKLSFTGSTPVGKTLMAQCAATVKKLSLELGGNAPFIVFEDADLDAAVEGAMASKFRNAGQTCVCANRVFVHSGVYEEFSRKLVHAVAALKVGSGMAAGVTLGPLIDARAVAKVERHVADAVARGARILHGGKRHVQGLNFFAPTVLGGVDATMQIAREETFGPVAALIRFDSEEDVIAQANASASGLAAYFYSRDVGRAWRVAEALEAGMVGVNTGMLSSEVAPFGGIKQSGVGREGSQHGLDDYLTMKYICMGGL